MTLRRVLSSDGKRMLWLMVALALLSAVSLARADEAPLARAYFDWARQAINLNRADLPQITQAADAAAPLLIEGKNLAVRGNGLNVELGGRAGGFYLYKSSTGKPGDVALLAIGSQPATEPDLQKHLAKAIDEIRQFKQAGSLVVVIASRAQLEKHKLLEEVQQQCDFLLDNHTPADDGLFTDRQGKAIIPTFPVANAITAWAWQAELFAACTRQGKTPAMYQSVAIPGARERNKALGTARFHDDITLPPIPAGKLGLSYLDGLDKLLYDVGTISWPGLVRASDRLYNTLADGGTAYVYSSAHYPPFHFGGLLMADPGCFPLLNKGSKKFLATPGEQDAILALGYCMKPGDPYWGDATIFENAGRGVAWVITSYDTLPQEIPHKDILVDQQWPAGDAVVSVEGYPVRIFPPSGVITETIAWAIIAQVNDQWQAQQAARRKPVPAQVAP